MQTRLQTDRCSTVFQLVLGIRKGWHSLRLNMTPSSVALCVTLMLLIITLTEANTTKSSFDVDYSPAKVLSRRKRFLIFPDGSSVQLVICTQNHGYLQIGDVVWFGNTAALAWELPTDPEAFDIFRDRYKLTEGNRRSDVIYYLDENGKIIDSKEYRRKFIVNPAFAKRSIDTSKNTTPTLSIKEMHNQQKNKNILEELDAKKIHFYREERQKLYVKLENFLQVLGWNGEECVLKMLCETAKLKNVQGSFLEELLKVLFTLPKVHVLSEVHNQYDDAHGANGDCSLLYPNCRQNTII